MAKKESIPSLNIRALAATIWILLIASLISCGNGGGTPITPIGPPPDFSLSATPPAITLESGTSQTISLLATGLNNFSSQVSIEATGLPAGVSLLPSAISLTPGMARTVTLSAGNSVTAATLNVTLTGTSGTLSHTAPLSLTTFLPPTSNTSPFRMLYIRTDASTPYFASWNSYWIDFNPTTSRFFVTDPFGNHVFVIDSTTESLVATIMVPGALSIDDSADHKTLYVATEVGDIYTIDPVAMKVTTRYTASTIGSTGFHAYSALVMADGNLALLGGKGLLPAVDGHYGFAIWNPTTNALSVYASNYGGPELGIPYQTVCGALENISVFARTPDRSNLLMVSADSDGTICKFDESTRKDSNVQIGGFIWQLAFSPDSTEMVFTAPAAMYNQVEVYNVQSLTKVTQYSVLGDTTSAASLLVSSDNKTLFISSPGLYFGYDLNSGGLLGAIPNIVVEPLSDGPARGPISGPNIQAFDGTGLLAGPLEEGVGLLDATMLDASRVGTVFLNGYLNPPSGPVAGQTNTSWLNYGDVVAAEAQRDYPFAASLKIFSHPRSLATGSGWIPEVYFGSLKTTAVTMTETQYAQQISVSAPPGAPGPADVYAQLSANGLQLIPEGFSYGPTILEATPNAATAEGGVGAVYGYGFGPVKSATVPSDLTITVGRNAATVLSYSSNPYNSMSPPLPLQAFAYTIPRGSSGPVDITVTSGTGSATLHNGMTYLPSIQQFSAPFSQLAQGIYDPHRDLYYFTDATQIMVFSRTSGQWLTPLSLPATITPQRLWGIGISADGSQLAVADIGARAIYVLNPDNPAAARSFVLPQEGLQPDSEPTSVAITNAGIVYFTVFTSGGTGYTVFFKLDTNSGLTTNYLIGTNSIDTDNYLRTVISSDEKTVYGNDHGEVFSVDTATDNVSVATEDPACCYGDYELTLSPSQTALAATGYFYDQNLNAAAQESLMVREGLGVDYFYGSKLSADGALLFQPTSIGIDVFDARLGNLLKRIALPVTLSANFDALASDGTDNILVAVTGQTGDGIAVIDLTSITPPPALTYATEARKNRPVESQASHIHLKSHSAIPSAVSDTQTPTARRLPHHVTVARLPGLK